MSPLPPNFLYTFRNWWGPGDGPVCQAIPLFPTELGPGNYDSLTAEPETGYPVDPRN
jgi:hypothetical protein